MIMRGPQWIVAALLAALAASGCGGPSKRTLAATEPGLSAASGGPDVAVIDRPAPARSVAFADRHPLFTKPRQYYENSTSKNKAVKTATAAVVGIPAGIFGELKQIVVGAPALTPTAY